MRSLQSCSANGLKWSQWLRKYVLLWAQTVVPGHSAWPQTIIVRSAYDSASHVLCPVGTDGVEITYVLVDRFHAKRRKLIRATFSEELTIHLGFPFGRILILRPYCVLHMGSLYRLRISLATHIIHFVVF